MEDAALEVELPEGSEQETALRAQLSIALSLKRIADRLDALQEPFELIAEALAAT